MRLKAQRCEFWLCRSLITFSIFALPLALPAQQPVKGSIQGRVLNALNGQPVVGAQVSAAPGPAGLTASVGGILGAAGIVNAPSGATVIRATTSAVAIPPAGPAITTGNDGKFSFTDLNPGTYRISVSANGYAPQQFGQLGPNLLGPAITITAAGEQINNGQPEGPSAQMSVNVTGDVEGIVLALADSVSIPGRVTIQGGVSAPPNLDVMRVSIRPSGLGMLTIGLSAPRPSQIAADGTFRIDGLRGGEYIVNVIGLPQGLYLESMDFGGADILKDVFKFSPGSSGTLNVVLRAGAGQLSGTILNAKNQPVAAAVVALIPAQRNRLDIYKTSITGANGSFAMTGVTLGEYSLFAWEAMEPNSHFYPDVLRQYESKGRSLRIVDGSNQTVELRVIPAQ